MGLLIAWIVRSGTPAVAAVGRTAPDFTVEVIDGGTFTLSDHRGRPVVLNLWASWCAPCREEIPAISAFATSHPDVTVLGVAVDDPIEMNTREFAAEIDASYPLALGTGLLEDVYPFLGLPATYVIDRRGVVVEFFNGIVDEHVLEELLANA